MSVFTKHDTLSFFIIDFKSKGGVISIDVYYEAYRTKRVGKNRCED